MKISIRIKQEDHGENTERFRADELTQEQKAQAYDALIEAMDDPNFDVTIKCYQNWIARMDGEFAVYVRVGGRSKKIMTTSDLQTALEAVVKWHSFHL